MELGMVGLGRMGANMVRRLQRGGHSCVAYDRDPSKVAGIDARGAGSLQDLVDALRAPRTVWVMLPAGAITEECVQELGRLLSKGDTVVDGGNTFWKDDVRRAAQLSEKGIVYLDVGTSGGVFGLDRGYCLMIGGEKAAVARLEPLFRTLAPGQGDVAPSSGRKPGSAEEGFLHCGAAGSGHFVKMVHNGIEYGLMQAYAEGFEIMHASSYELDLAAISELWMQGSVVRSWLLELAGRAFRANGQDLTHLQGFVEDSGEGRWTVIESIEKAVPTPTITASLQARFRSRQENSYGARFLNVVRNEFGGHAVKKA
jgi:6-phosphogluconate dehydrogenase